MTKDLATVTPMHAETLSKVLLDGNLSSLNAGQRVEYMTRVCESLGLNPLTKPFEFISLNGKLVMYAKRDCTEQLRKIHGVSVTIVSRELVEGIYVVTARAEDKTGRHDESIGAVAITGLNGEAKANALMKAETKAKRRVTLSVCGLGMLDEVEAEPLAYTPPPVRESPERIAGTHGDRPLDAAASGASSDLPSSASDASARSTSVPATNGKPRTAADVKPTGGPITPAQVKLVHVLKAKVGGVFSGDGTDPRDKWSKTLGVYRKEDGSRCAHTNELSCDQGSHLIDRMNGYIEKQAKNASAGVDLDAAVPSKAPALPDLLRDLVSDPEDDFAEAQWLGARFGVDSVHGLTTVEAETALQLLIAMKQGPDELDRVETIARTTGRIR